MLIPDNYVTVTSTLAATYDEKVVVTVTHTSRDCTEVHVFDRATGRKCGWGMHRHPAAAFRFVDAFMADDGDDYDGRAGGWPHVSPRYSRAVSAAY